MASPSGDSSIGFHITTATSIGYDHMFSHAVNAITIQCNSDSISSSLNLFVFLSMISMLQLEGEG